MARAAIFGVALAIATPAVAQTSPVPFDDPAWDLSGAPGATVIEYQGRKSLAFPEGGQGGTALLEGVDLADGTVEVSLSSPAGRNFAFVHFRMQSPAEREEVYLRMHKSGSPDALQYTPTFQGSTAWQLHGPGDGWAPVVFDRADWVRLRLEIMGERLRVWVDDQAEPALVTRRRRPERGGGLGLSAGTNTYFSDFRFTPAPSVGDGSMPAPPSPPGTITQWELSAAFPATNLDPQRAPGANLDSLRAPVRAEHTWQRATTEPGGLLNLARYLDPTTVQPPDARPGTPPLSATAFARTTLRSDRARVAKLLFGYSDDVLVYLNGRPLFTGRAGFQSRDPLFQGMIGYNDAVFLDLREGDNELVFAVSEQFGGWGLMARLEDPSGITVDPGR